MLELQSASGSSPRPSDDADADASDIDAGAGSDALTTYYQRKSSPHNEVSTFKVPPNLVNADYRLGPPLRGILTSRATAEGEHPHHDEDADSVVEDRALRRDLLTPYDRI